MDDNTFGLLFIASLIAALVICYVTSKVIDYLREGSARRTGEYSERGRDGVEP